MPRTKLPDVLEMAAFVRGWLASTTASDDLVRALEAGDVTVLKLGGLALDESLKLHYHAWKLVELASERGRRLSSSDVRELVGRGDVPSARLEDLWKARVVLVRPLGTYVHLPPRTPATGLKAAARLGLVDAPHSERQSAEDAPDIRFVLANTPSQEIDRATRGSDAWNTDTLAYERSGVLITYGEDGVPIDVARAELSEMDPRTSDVWRLLVAKTLESGTDDELVAITVQPGELALAMGFKKHPKGGVRGEDLVKCADAMTRLERLWLRVTVDVTPGTMLPDMPGERVASLETETKVIHVIRRGSARTVDGRRIPRYWQVALGSWAKVWPKAFAPLFRSLVELPANNATSVWAKQIGAELAFLWGLRARSGEAQRVTVRELLSNAMLLADVEKLRARGELSVAVERFARTLDSLLERGVHAGWSYDKSDFERMTAAERTRRFFDAWLGASVIVVPPAAVLHALAGRPPFVPPR
ncbi:hypothetical protein [Deinococcus yavapaiensis]|uniref:Uncharacterized protein n=1 Tax=Deinococcus yavapaiensis KR-236 TaxID=694435 RepID=A0A318S3I8_9DEIO|nr:hypothetical protein [Deinococcus yavapaiensis]PYE50579.1 hypothetical protein DES52_11797 [Deinococcus yavapaiensis KR-236]